MKTGKLVAPMAVITVVAAMAIAVQAQDTLSPAARWAQVTACVAQPSADGRHACIDAILRAAGFLDPVREQEQQQAEFGRTEREQRVRETSVPAAAPVTAPVIGPVTAPEAAAASLPPAAVLPDRIDNISTTIAAARVGSNGRVLVATAEATVWRQLEGETFRIAPSPGTAFSVQRGALGSYICTVGRSNSFRCARVD